MKRNQKRTSHKPTNKRQSFRSKFVAPETLEEFFRMSKQDQEFWSDIGQIVTEVGKGTPLATVSRRFGHKPGVVRQLVPNVFYKGSNRRYLADLDQPLLRVLVIPSGKGLREVGIDKLSEASVIGEHWNAVQRYLETGDDSALQNFHGKHITDANGERIELLTSLEELDRLASAGVLSFESIYARVA